MSVTLFLSQTIESESVWWLLQFYRNNNVQLTIEPTEDIYERPSLVCRGGYYRGLREVVGKLVDISALNHMLTALEDRADLYGGLQEVCVCVCVCVAPQRIREEPGKFLFYREELTGIDLLALPYADAQQDKLQDPVVQLWIDRIHEEPSLVCVDGFVRGRREVIDKLIEIGAIRLAGGALGECCRDGRLRELVTTAPDFLLRHKLTSLDVLLYPYVTALQGKKLAGNRFSVFIDDDESDSETKAGDKKKKQRKNKKKKTKSSTESSTNDGASRTPAPAHEAEETEP
ncbi:unnamed protein product [Vitrella brassicaformis CCMP3155]|uniref:Uncharacterized protein n=1 Tax=Vitrella brassicaformis (strain CCMP3155) TaxID=1169540 RepID=A0A0G4EFX9_VITBC|nr:unnamed protein product [Vitrella brassicaformis CCMP3155]|eukprot:CEL94290.1 unnamed protein product [Vitrella brassicaformis CCMP3155]